MMKYFLYSFFFLFLACNSVSDSEPERIEIQPVLVYDDIESIMPGSFIAYQNYLLWEDPFTNEGLVHIIDLKENKEIASLIDIGDGPEEFVTPSLGRGFDNEVIIFDLNKDKRAYFNIDSLKKSSFQIHYQKYPTSDISRIVGIGNSEFVILNDSMVRSGNFRSPPINENAENFSEIMQAGNLLYNPQRNSLVYSNMRFPYMVLFKQNGGDLDQVWERKGKFDYQFADNKIKLDGKRTGAAELALSKDYILTRERDYKNDPTDESTVRRNFSKLSTTVFVYDYDSNLIKIVNLGMPVLRIAATEDSNTVYAIVVNPDFQIVKFDL